MVEFMQELSSSSLECVTIHSNETYMYAIFSIVKLNNTIELLDLVITNSDASPLVSKY